ncbi:MAG TPA: L,D-transpeptidase, partial [Patescibacteria group bacterium]
YDLPGVPNILSFLGPYTIHGTYWHNNFGQPMSHGCINMTIADSKWLYDWADLETSVIIH